MDRVDYAFIRFTASAFRKLPSIYVFSYFPFGFEGRMWDLIVSVPDHCLSFYFACRGSFSARNTLKSTCRKSFSIVLAIFTNKRLRLLIVLPRNGKKSDSLPVIQRY